MRLIEPVDPVQLQKLREARWSEEKAWTWYAEVGPIVGCNYLPRTAVNMTEMWHRRYVRSEDNRRRTRLGREGGLQQPAGVRAVSRMER